MCLNYSKHFNICLYREYNQTYGNYKAEFYSIRINKFLNAVMKWKKRLLLIPVFFLPVLFTEPDCT